MSRNKQLILYGSGTGAWLIEQFAILFISYLMLIMKHFKLTLKTFYK